jgi:hypothetical protein
MLDQPRERLSDGHRSIARQAPVGSPGRQTFGFIQRFRGYAQRYRRSLSFAGRQKQVLDQSLPGEILSIPRYWVQAPASRVGAD